MTDVTGGGLGERGLLTRTGQAVHDTREWLYEQADGEPADGDPDEGAVEAGFVETLDKAVEGLRGISELLSECLGALPEGDLAQRVREALAPTDDVCAAISQREEA